MNQSSAFCHQFVECGSRIGNPWLGFPAIDFRIFRHLRYNSRMTTSDRELYELEQIVDELRRRIQVLESRLVTVEQQQGPIMKAAARFRTI